ncbi:AAA family ATPase [Thermococcus sp.]|uniref:McrB family protein n=1 Tax=Thermococcus sp. TaxID=35749 RepID=UPI00260FAD2D|nr:AAA family ATPase [Thermococcus sp.]
MGRFEPMRGAVDSINSYLSEEYEEERIGFAVEEMKLSDNGDYVAVLVRDDYDSRFLHVFETSGKPLSGWEKGVPISCQSEVIIFPGKEYVGVFSKCGGGEITLYPLSGSPREEAKRITFSKPPIYVFLTANDRVIIFGDMRLNFTAPAEVEVVFIPRLPGGYAFFHSIYDTPEEVYILHTFKEPGGKKMFLRVGKVPYPLYPYYSPLEFWDGVEVLFSNPSPQPIKGTIGDIFVGDRHYALLGTKMGKELYLIIDRKLSILPLPGELVFARFTDRGLFIVLGQFRGYLYGGFVPHDRLESKKPLLIDELEDRTLFGRYNPEFLDPKFAGISRSGDVLYLGRTSGKTSSSGDFYYYLLKDNPYLYSHRAGEEAQEREEEGESLSDVLETFKGLILYGPPGTGKTKTAVELAKRAERFEIVTFHQSYSYEDFIEGFRPVEKNGGLVYLVSDGVLKRMAIEAIYRGLRGSTSGDYTEMKREVLEFLEKRRRGEKVEFNPRGRYVLIIDEINRGNISRILGEAITLLDPDKRLGGEMETIITLPYSGEPFALPPNLFIVGTMNSTDRSIAFLDMALRRRFAFVELLPQPELLGSVEVGGVNLQHLLVRINEAIEEERGKDYTIGHGYLMEVALAKDRVRALRRVFYYKILPLLQEYFYGNWEALRRALPGFSFIDEKGRIAEMSDEEFIETLRRLVSEK